MRKALSRREERIATDIYNNLLRRLQSFVDVAAALCYVCTAASTNRLNELYTGDKMLLKWIYCSVLVLLLGSPSFAQTSQSQNAARPEQWVSHQMNQPPPAADKYSMSQDLLDDIRQLYLDAKMESEKQKQPAVGK